jgi:hypothetical protein
MEGSKAERRTGRWEEMIDAPMKSLFPLACPVEEYKWIDGWDFELVYSECGAMEKQCIFNERLTGGFLFAAPDLETTWIVCEHDRERYVMRAVLLIGDRAAAMFEVEGRERDEASAQVVWSYTITGRSEAGNQALAALEPGRIDTMLGVLAKSFRHYGETGKKLPSADALAQALASRETRLARSEGQSA